MSLYVTSIDGMGSGEDSGGGALQNLFGMTGADHMHIAKDFIAQAGVRDLSRDFEVIEDTPAALSVEVRTGTAYVENSSFTINSDALKYWRVESDATETASIDSNASGSTRIDLIAIKIDTGVTPNDDASNVASVVVVKGTPGAGAPALPNDHLELAEVSVANGASSITTGNITDKREKAFLVDWSPVEDSWTYSSWDVSARTGAITINSGGVNRYHVGQKIRFNQPTDGKKYGIITKVTDTVLTVYLGTDYDLDNEAITNVLTSGIRAPFGFPMDPDKWTQEFSNNTNQSQATPTSSTWYNIGSSQLEVPTGSWDVYYNVCPESTDTGTTLNYATTLSTANNSESDVEMTAFSYSKDGSSDIKQLIDDHHRRKNITVSSPTLYYLNAKTLVVGAVSLSYRGDLGATIIRAVCAFL